MSSDDSNANSLCRHVLPKPMGIITISQIHGSFADSRVRVLSPQPRSRVSVARLLSVQPNCCRPCRNASARAGPCGSSAARDMSTPMRRIRSGCCARAESGHDADAPPSSVMN